MGKCCVRVCKNRNDTRGWKKRDMNTTAKVTFHRFPKNPKDSEEWCKIVGIDASTISMPSARICSQHFSADLLEIKGPSTRLKTGAMPSVPEQNLDYTPNFSSIDVTHISHENYLAENVQLSEVGNEEMKNEDIHTENLHPDDQLNSMEVENANEPNVEIGNSTSVDKAVTASPFEFPEGTLAEAKKQTLDKSTEVSAEIKYNSPEKQRLRKRMAFLQEEHSKNLKRANRSIRNLNEKIAKLTTTMDEMVKQRLITTEAAEETNFISVDEVPVNETLSSAEVFQDDSENIKIKVFQDDSDIIETEVCQDDSNDNETELVDNNVEKESDKMCRFCMKKTKVAKHIFEDYIDDDEHIYLAVNDCLYPLMVVIEDHLSKYICNECLNTLSHFVEFRDFVLKNDKIQREQLSPLMTWGAPGQKRDTEAEIEPHILKKRKIVHRPEQKNSIVVSGQSKLTNQDTGGKDFSKESFGPDQQNNGDSSLVAPILLSVLHKNVSGEDQGEGTQPKTILQECFKKSDYNAEQDSVPKTAIWVKNLKQSDSKVEASNSSQTTCDNIQFCLANGYLMEHKVLKGNLRYQKCALTKCPALGTQEVLMPGVFANTISITKKHNHEKPTEFDIKKQKFISIIRKRLQNAKGSSIKYIYDEVCKLDPELTQLVPLKELTKEICNL